MMNEDLQFRRRIQGVMRKYARSGERFIGGCCGVCSPRGGCCPACRGGGVVGGCCPLCRGGNFYQGGVVSTEDLENLLEPLQKVLRPIQDQCQLADDVTTAFNAVYENAQPDDDEGTEPMMSDDEGNEDQERYQEKESVPIMEEHYNTLVKIIRRAMQNLGTNNILLVIRSITEDLRDQDLELSDLVRDVMDRDGKLFSEEKLNEALNILRDQIMKAQNRTMIEAPPIGQLDDDNLLNFDDLPDFVSPETRARDKAYLDAIDAENYKRAVDLFAENEEEYNREEEARDELRRFFEDDNDATTGTNYAEREAQAEEEAVIEEMEDEINGAGQPRDRRLKRANKLLEKKLRRKSNRTTDDMADDEDVELARRAIGRSFDRSDPNVYCEDTAMRRRRGFKSRRACWEAAAEGVDPEYLEDFFPEYIREARQQEAVELKDQRKMMRKDIARSKANLLDMVVERRQEEIREAEDAARTALRRAQKARQKLATLDLEGLDMSGLEYDPTKECEDNWKVLGLKSKKDCKKIFTTGLREEIPKKPVSQRKSKASIEDSAMSKKSGLSWIEHVKAYAKKNKVTYSAAMSLAAPSWRGCKQLRPCPPRKKVCKKTPCATKRPTQRWAKPAATKKRAASGSKTAAKRRTAKKKAPARKKRGGGMVQ